MKKKNTLISCLLCLTLMVTYLLPTPVQVKAAEATKQQSSYDQTAINDADMLTYFNEHRNNSDPIIFVHGLFGWGNDELYGIHYWGGKGSIKSMLEEDGYSVYTPTIGPIASNWDRACELYAYLVGGTVDYGKAHSEKYGHARYGRTYEGVYKELLTSNDAKIHLIGHSMGGETIRVLAQLLEQGDSEEQQATGKDTSILFQGDHHWIRSITTIATPHDGSQYDELGTRLDPFFHDLFASLAAQTGTNQNKLKLDFQMDQWGLKQKEGESYADYCKRVFASKIWSNTTDLSSYDLSLEGAKELNSWVKTQDDIYYFSISCGDTHAQLLTKHQVPNKNMNLILRKSSLVMGQFTQNKKGKVKVTKEWWENDGIVSSRSAIAPHEGSTDTVRAFDGTFVKGTWNYLGQVENIDHLEVVAQDYDDDRAELQQLYRNLASMLTSL